MDWGSAILILGQDTLQPFQIKRFFSGPFTSREKVELMSAVKRATSNFARWRPWRLRELLIFRSKRGESVIRVQVPTFIEDKRLHVGSQKIQFLTKCLNNKGLFVNEYLQQNQQPPPPSLLSYPLPVLFMGLNWGQQKLIMRRICYFVRVKNNHC